MGNWVAVRNGAHPADKWELYNIANDPAQNNNLADQNLALLQKLIAVYQNHSKNVGIVIPRGPLFAFQVSHLTPDFNETQAVQMGYILPEQLVIAKSLVQNGTFAGEAKKLIQNGTPPAEA